MAMFKNDFKPWIICVGILLFILVALAAFLPHWLEWTANQNANSGILLGILSPGGTTTTRALDVNAGLWRTEVSHTARGTSLCATTTTAANCVCPSLLDGDIDSFPTGTLDDINSNSIPTCRSLDVNGCTASRVLSTTTVNWATSVEAECDPTILADILRCGARTDATNTNILDSNAISSACNGVYSRLDDCMANYLSAARALFVISLILIILIIILYIFMMCVGPLALPKVALVGVILVFLNALALTLALIFAVLGFRFGCGNDWDALTGDAHWGVCLYLAIIAVILAWLWLCWAIQVWRQAKQIRNWFLYDQSLRYGPPVYKAPVAPVFPAAPPAPMYASDYGGYGYPAYPQYPTPAAPPAMPMTPPAGYPYAYGYGSEPIEI